MKIDLEDHPNIAAMIKDTYTGNRIIDVSVPGAPIEEGKPIPLDLTIEDAWSILGEVQRGSVIEWSRQEKRKGCCEWIMGVDVQEVSIEGDDITIKLDLTISGMYSVSGAATLSLQDDNSLVEAIKEIIE